MKPSIKITTIEQHWRQQEPRIVLLLVAWLAVFFMSRLPYVNLLVSSDMVVALCWIVSILIYRLTFRQTVGISVISILVIWWATSMAKTDIAEIAGNVFYYLIIIASVQYGLEVIATRDVR